LAKNVFLIETLTFFQDDSMKKKDMEYFRNMLQIEMDELQKKADAAVGELIGTAYSNEADPLDRATDEQALNSQLRIRDRESRLIAKIEKCLQAIEDGSYGICEGCEEPIGIARLKARPVTSYCIVCKTKQEILERITGG
jgi:DnaK suppressor protein